MTVAFKAPAVVAPGVESAERLAGEPVADAVRRTARERCRALARAGRSPTLGTILASDDPADERFVDLKHDAAAELGIASRDRRYDATVSAADLVEAVESFSADPEVHGVFVQAPLPGHVDPDAVREAIAPVKDVDCFHPENLGRLVAGEPMYLPATPAAVRRLFGHYDVPVAGQDVTLVGRSAVIGRPLANLLWQRRTGDATVTVTHSRTRDLAAKTRAADIVITAAGEPGLVDGSMLADGATVVDVSATRTTVDGEVRYVGDVDAESAAAVAGRLTPVPGGVGPVTVAMLLSNVVLAAGRQADDIDATTWMP